MSRSRALYALKGENLILKEIEKINYLLIFTVFLLISPIEFLTIIFILIKMTNINLMCGLILPMIIFPFQVYIEKKFIKPNK
jgi:hypothetical protein